MGWPSVLRLTASSAPKAASRSHAASDSLVDDWGCLTNRPEREAFPGNINLQCCRPLNSPLDQRFGQRVFYILLQCPPQRARAIIPVRARFLEDPLARFRRQYHLHLPVNQRVVQLPDKQIDDSQQILVA